MNRQPEGRSPAIQRERRTMWHKSMSTLTPFEYFLLCQLGTSGWPHTEDLICREMPLLLAYIE